VSVWLTVKEKKKKKKKKKKGQKAGSLRFIYLLIMSFFAPPAGFRFIPEAEDLVQFYLLPKATGQQLPFTDVIFEWDFYGEKQPSEIWDMFVHRHHRVDETQEDLFFFTKLKCLSDSSVDRSVGSGGSWSNESCKTIYERGTRIPIAQMRKFRYVNPGSSQDGAWLMREYSLPMTKALPAGDSSSSSSYVVCRLRKNNRPDSDSDSDSSEPESVTHSGNQSSQKEKRTEIKKITENKKIARGRAISGRPAK
jgi:hypothetical protein